MMIKYAFSILALGFTGICSAQNPVSVQVINTVTGQPAAKINVILEAQQKDKWVKINEASTDDNGQISAFYPENKPLDKGIYRATFQTGDWYKAKNQRSFYPDIPVTFIIDGALSHYQIPLMISPFGYSTYRAS